MTLMAYVKVSRPPLLLLGFLASLGLLSWTGTLQADLFKSILIVLTVGLGNWAWTLYNEFKDRDVDVLNKPHKPLPSGQVDAANVTLLFFLSVYLSVICNLFLVFTYGVVYAVGFLAHLASFVYNSGRKDVLGNMCMAFTYGVAAFLSLYPEHLLFCVSFALLTLAHNVTNQVQDVKAERTMRITTIPQQLGKKGTFRLIEVLLLIAFIAFMKLFLTSNYTPLLIFATATIITMLAGLSIIWEKKAQIIVENLARRLGRLLLIIGFTAMLFLPC